MIKLAREKGRKTEEKADEYVRNIHKINVKKTIFNLVFDFDINDNVLMLLYHERLNPEVEKLKSGDPGVELMREMGAATRWKKYLDRLNNR